MREDHQALLRRIQTIAPVLGVFVSVSLFGLTALAYGYTPFSPLFSVHHPHISVMIYTMFLISLCGYELRLSRYSVRPERSDDNHHPFWLYLGTLLISCGYFLPSLWSKLGELYLRGLTFDEALYHTMSTWLTCLVLGLSIMKLRGWAHECKDISRVNRVSPPGSFERDDVGQGEERVEDGALSSPLLGSINPQISLELLTSTELHKTRDGDDQEGSASSNKPPVDPEVVAGLKEHYQQQRRTKLMRDIRGLSHSKLSGLTDSLEDHLSLLSDDEAPKTRRSTGSYDTRFTGLPPAFNDEPDVQIAVPVITSSQTELDVFVAHAQIYAEELTPRSDDYVSREHVRREARHQDHHADHHAEPNDTIFMSPPEMTDCGTVGAEMISAETRLMRQIDDQLSLYQDVEAGSVPLYISEVGIDVSLLTSSAITPESELTEYTPHYELDHKPMSPSDEDLNQVELLSPSDTLVTPPQPDVIRTLTSLSSEDLEIWDEVNEII